MIEQEIYAAEKGAPPVSVNDQHLACVLLLDTSASMQNGNAIGALNKALKDFKTQCEADDALRRGLDIAVVSFNSEVIVNQPFVPISEMSIPELTADGQTAMGAALDTAINMLEKRKALYKEIGVPYHRPWIFMISDGEPNDSYESVFEKVHQMQSQKKLEVWAVGVPGYDRQILKSLTKRVIELDTGLNFAGLFEWLSTSLSKKSESSPGSSVKYDILPQGSQVVPDDWGN